MENTAIQIVSLLLGSEILTILVTRFLDWLKNKKKKPNSMESGLMWLLHDKLEYLMTKYMMKADEEAAATGKEACISQRDVEFISHGYSYYKELGGNGDLEKIYKDFNSYKTNYRKD